MNKLSKYIAIATLASTVTISAPIHTYACESHTKDNHNQTTQHQNDPNLGIKILPKRRHFIYRDTILQNIS